jgi:alpha-tubulin suppressor-like RCC1 family protein
MQPMTRLAVGTLVVLAACEGPFVAPAPYPPPPPPPASVTVTPDSAGVITDDTLRLAAVVRDSAGNPLTGSSVTWVASDTTIVNVVNQLGTIRAQRPGSTTVRALAGTVSGHVTVFVTPLVFGNISAGANHVCAIANNHHAYCWGDNDDAEIGTGAASFVEPVPRRVLGTTTFTAVAAGGASTCAVDIAGAAWCWGRAVNGRLGRDGAPGDPAVPSLVVTGLHFVTVSVGGAHVCGLATSAQIACWGAGAAGQIGDGGMGDRTTPAVVSADFFWTAVAAGASHTCALVVDTTAWCWGANAAGQLGDSTTTDQGFPTPVRGAVRFGTITAGGDFTCALTASGAAFCWGGNASGETGSGLPDTIVSTPAAVAGGLVFRTITAGGRHACGVAADSLAYCWGANGNGQLGDSSQTPRATPVAVRGGLRFADVRAGAGFTCGLTGGLVVYCWGDGTQGQLGRTTLGSSTVPVRVAGQ